MWKKVLVKLKHVKRSPQASYNFTFHTYFDLNQELMVTFVNMYFQMQSAQSCSNRLSWDYTHIKVIHNHGRNHSKSHLTSSSTGHNTSTEDGADYPSP